jgi:hypothetical protein
MELERALRWVGNERVNAARSSARRLVLPTDHISIERTWANVANVRFVPTADKSQFQTSELGNNTTSQSRHWTAEVGLLSPIAFIDVEVINAIHP